VAFNATCDGPFAHILIGLGIFHLSGDVTARGTASKVRGRFPVIWCARAEPIAESSAIGEGKLVLERRCKMCLIHRGNRDASNRMKCRTETRLKYGRGARVRTYSKLLAPNGRSAASPFSPSDHEMPIQILRAIFVAIKHYVFGLMAQKYSISSARRASSPRYNAE